MNPSKEIWDDRETRDLFYEDFELFFPRGEVYDSDHPERYEDVFTSKHKDMIFCLGMEFLSCVCWESWWNKRTLNFVTLWSCEDLAYVIYVLEMYWKPWLELKNKYGIDLTEFVDQENKSTKKGWKAKKKRQEKAATNEEEKKEEEGESGAPAGSPSKKPMKIRNLDEFKKYDKNKLCELMHLPNTLQTKVGKEAAMKRYNEIESQIKTFFKTRKGKGVHNRMRKWWELERAKVDRSDDDEEEKKEEETKVEILTSQNKKVSLLEEMKDSQDVADEDDWNPNATAEI